MILSDMNSIFPFLASNNPTITLRSVDFPDPFGPIIATKLPSLT